MPECSKLCDSYKEEQSKLRNDNKPTIIQNCPRTSHCKSELMNHDKSNDDSYIGASSLNESFNH